jgi:ubiquinone/menaquinone biosynthesis C-methylase UbiE
MSILAKRDYFNSLASRWDFLPSPPDAAERVGRFVRRVVRPADRLILDLGCGTGILVGPLLEAGGSARQILEVDLAVEMLRQNKRKWTDRRVHGVCAEALRLPFREGSFDLLLCFGVVPHLGPIEAALESLLRYLRPGGTLAVGHLMGSEALNAFHGSLQGPVNQDKLPAAGALSSLLERLGALPLCAEEAPDWYLVEAEKR